MSTDNQTITMPDFNAYYTRQEKKLVPDANEFLAIKIISSGIAETNWMDISRGKMEKIFKVLRREL